MCARLKTPNLLTDTPRNAKLETQSPVAQWWSKKLLTSRLPVRVWPGEPIQRTANGGFFKLNTDENWQPSSIVPGAQAATTFIFTSLCYNIIYNCEGGVWLEKFYYLFPVTIARNK